MAFRQHMRVIGLLLGLVWAGTVRAEDPALPTFRTYAGAFFAGQNHIFFVESELHLPLLQQGPFGLYYRHRESTPFLNLRDKVQVELLYDRDELQADFQVADPLRLMAVGGYHSGYATDRAGLESAYAVGGGLGSPVRTDGERWRWYALAGGYLDRRDLDADWWSDLYGSWRVFDFAQTRYLGSDYRASAALAAKVETVNRGDRVRGLYRLGPELQLLTANGNRANLQFQWYRNDQNPFYGEKEDGFLAGLDVVSSRNEDYLFQALEKRQAGWFPLIWGAYDFGAFTERQVQRFEMNVEAVDFVVAEHRVTLFVWYESRQEHRLGDFDNINYSVTLGLQTPLGITSPLPPNHPLVVGFDFLHRSDHALNPNAERVAAVGEPTSIGPLILNGSLNLLPRFRLQTLGWDLPYRDPGMYDRKTAWLGYLDWRVTTGISNGSSRRRGKIAGQLGANVDLATVQGFVVYARGIGSMGNETPDWLGELGVRRPMGRVFGRLESYGVTHEIAHGDTFLLGVGVNL